MRTSLTIAAIFLIMVLGAAMARSARSQVRIHITSCPGTRGSRTLSIGAQVHPGAVLQVSAPIRGITQPAATVMLPPGGYTANVTDDTCNASIEFGVLPGLNRSISVQLNKPRIAGSQSSYMYEGRHGDLAGSGVPEGARVWIESIESPRRFLSAITENGAFYFDHVPAGSYRLYVAGANWSRVKAVVVPGDFSVRRIRI